MAIEYYDSIFNYDFHNHYLNKVNELLSKDSIIKYLDDINKISNSEQIDILKYDADKFKAQIFPEIKTEFKTNYQKSIEADVLKTFEDFKLDDKIKFNKMKKKHKLVSAVRKYEHQSSYIFNEQNKEKMNETLNGFNQNLSKIKDNIDNDVQSQLNRFEELKRKKKESIMVKIDPKLNDSNNSNSVITNDIEIINEIELKDCENDESELNFVKRSSIKSEYNEEMFREIEDYKENHFKEMNEEIGKLKESHMKEIQSFESLVDSNPELIECLKEDIDNHISSLRGDYQEKLEVEIRKIKKKYQLK